MWLYIVLIEIIIWLRLLLMSSYWQPSLLSYFGHFSQVGSPFSIPKVTCEKCGGLASGYSSWTNHHTGWNKQFPKLKRISTLERFIKTQAVSILDFWFRGSKISRLSSNSPCSRGWFELLNLLLPPPSARISGMFQGTWFSFCGPGKGAELRVLFMLDYALSPRICISNRVLVAFLTGVLAAVWEPVCLELSSLGNSWIIFWTLTVWFVDSSSKQSTHVSTRAAHCYCLKPFHFLLFWLRNFVCIWWQLLAGFSLGFCPSVHAISLFWDTEFFEGFPSPLNLPCTLHPSHCRHDLIVC